MTPDAGGKAPESSVLRAELNKIDAIGLKTPHAQRMAQALKDTPLPEKVSPGGAVGFYGAHSSYTPGMNLDLENNLPSCIWDTFAEIDVQVANYVKSQF